MRQLKTFHCPFLSDGQPNSAGDHLFFQPTFNDNPGSRFFALGNSWLSVSNIGNGRAIDDADSINCIVVTWTDVMLNWLNLKNWFVTRWLHNKIWKMLNWLKLLKEILVSQCFGSLHKPSSGVITIQTMWQVYLRSCSWWWKQNILEDHFLSEYSGRSLFDKYMPPSRLSGFLHVFISHASKFFWTKKWLHRYCYIHAIVTFMRCYFYFPK